MQQPLERRQVTAPAVVGAVLIAVGIVAILVRATGINLFGQVAAWGWPFFIIIPGLVLLALALVPRPPRGVGFATAGSIVTSVGAILLYQQRTGHWESWAYAWALIPLAAGLALTLYGLLARERGMTANGIWMAGVAAVLFLAGAWFFEGVFAGETGIIDAGNWWPVLVIILGALIALRAIVLPPAKEPPAKEPPAHDAGGPPTA